MTTNHTAGPWFFDPTHKSEINGTGVDVGQIITTDAMVRICDSVEERNAPVIVAAPDMLDALVRIVALCEATNMPSALGADISHIARQALVKALPTKETA